MQALEQDPYSTETPRCGSPDLPFAPETGPHAPRIRASVFNRNGRVVLKMVTARGAAGQREFATMDEAFAGMRALHVELSAGAA